MQEKKIINIPAELYEQLWQYCEDKNIPFANFITDSLESSMYVEDQNILLDKKQANIENLTKNITKECNDSYRRGFRDGFSSAFLINQKKLAISLQSGMLEDFIKANPFKIPKGQMDLFE